MARRRRAEKIQLVLFFTAVALLPLVVRNAYYLHILTVVGLNLILATGLNLLMGYAGQVSLGHAAFYGIGAYASGILTATYGWNPWLAMLAAIVITSAVAWLVGKPTLHLKGHYLAMATLGVGIIVSVVIRQWSEMTGGPQGLMNIPSITLAGWELRSDMDVHYFYFVWGWGCLLSVLFSNLVASRPGRALRALHDSELAAETLGVDTAAFKVRAFVISAAYASIAGTLYAHSSMRFLSPTPFDFHKSIALLVMVVLGGQGTLWGPVLGAATITFIEEVLRPYADYDIIAYGLLLMFMMVVMPGGVARALGSLADWLRERIARRSGERDE
ncbi:MAG: branched-chain amino acid ABC transporter permease [Armatimonadota bacterium]|nr:branched-chain amino acid ABC transporter permease [Armatimonadota bacterium]